MWGGGLIRFLLSGELVLAYATQRTYEVLRNLFPRCAGLYACLGHSNFGVILPSAYFTYVLCHNRNSLKG